MLLETNLFYTVDKVKTAIERLQYFVPPEGYYLAFSGGKDSQTIYHLALEAGVKFDAHFNLTTVDPPELVRFIKSNYPEVIIERPKLTMWQLIEKKGLPTRLHRWCCSILKEHGGIGRLCVTGVRWAESNARSQRRPFEIVTAKSADKKLFNDNDEDRRLFETCSQKGKRVINPIIDWEESDVWEYIRGRGLEYCKLYDEGFKRIGCIGCPMADKQRIKEFERYPRYLANYKRAIAKFIPKYLERSVAKGKTPQFRTTDEMYEWWIYGNKSLNDGNQLTFEEFYEDEDYWEDDGE